MGRKRLTQVCPWLLPLRKNQRLFCFYLGMNFDKAVYTKGQREDRYGYKLYETKSELYNKETGFDMIYQENKVFNLKLAAKKLNNLVIWPGETFSFWRAIRFADKETPYKDGLAVVDGKLTTVSAGGMCQLSNLLFLLFLHTPLSIIERHGHTKKDFPDPKGTELLGVDATVSEGWQDLKVKNETQTPFQICLDFDEVNIIGNIGTSTKHPYKYEVVNKDMKYIEKKDTIYQEIYVYQIVYSCTDELDSKEIILYKNLCEIGYDIPIEERGEQ